MSQKSPQSDEEVLPFPDFHEDIFADEPPKPHPRRRLIILASILCVLLLLGIALIVVAQHRPRVVYQVQSVTEGDLQLMVNANGQLQTTIYTVNFVGSGKLAEVDVTIGQQVKKDQILAKLDATALQNALNEAQSNVDSAQTTVNSGFWPFSHLFRVTQPASEAIFSIRPCSSMSSRIIGVAVSFAVKFLALRRTD